MCLAGGRIAITTTLLSLIVDNLRAVLRFHLRGAQIVRDMTLISGRCRAVELHDSRQ
jgi:hypothetical protein